MATTVKKVEFSNKVEKIIYEKEDWEETEFEKIEEESKKKEDWEEIEFKEIEEESKKIEEESKKIEELQEEINDNLLDPRKWKKRPIYSEDPIIITLDLIEKRKKKRTKL
jgi:hypothetical protein